MKTMKQNGMENGLNSDICASVHELIDWQIIQYRRAVDEHRADLSKAEGRCVAWQDAEKDFSKHDQARIAENSRVDYCGLVCSNRSKCLIALRFLQSKNTQPLYRVG